MLSTLNPDSDSQSEISTVVRPPPPKSRNPSAAKRSAKRPQAAKNPPKKRPKVTDANSRCSVATPRCTTKNTTLDTEINATAEASSQHPEDEDEDLVQNSPPRSNLNPAHHIFRKCFQTTFDPSTLPGHDTILAEDSDDEK